MDLSTLDCIYLDRGENTQCIINPFGGTITSWKVNDLEQLFVSRHAIYDNLKALHGGIMLVFPHYRYWTIGPLNGFANLMTWSIETDPHKLETGDIEIVLKLNQGQVSNNIWNYEYTIKYKITLMEKSLELHLEIENQSKCSFYFHLMFSNYIKVPNVEMCTVNGLAECITVDRKDDNYHYEQQEEDEIEFTEEIYKLFRETGEKHTITNVMMERKMYITKYNLPETAIYNMWEVKAKHIEDFGSDEWSKMLLVELGHLTHPLILLPEDTVEVNYKIRVKHDDEDNDPPIQFY